MNNKGLTLVELIAVIVVIGLISLIIYPSITKNMTDSQNKTIEIQKKSIKEAAELYVSENIGTSLNFDDENNKEEITLNQLIEDGYLKGEYENPKTGKTYDLNVSKVIITKENNNYIYEVELITK